MNNETKYVVDVMTPSPTVIGPNARAWHAERVAEERGVHDLLVMAQSQCSESSAHGLGMADLRSEFQVVVPLQTGANEVVAICDGDAGVTSEPLMLEGRLEERPTARIDVSVSFKSRSNGTASQA
jgi:hypothetical protein